MAADVAEARPPLPHHVGTTAVGQAFPSLPKVAVARVWTTAAVAQTFPSLLHAVVAMAHHLLIFTTRVEEGKHLWT